MARMEASPEAKLNKQSTLGYKSFGSSYQLADGSSPNDLTCDLAKKHAPLHLKQLAPNGTNLFDQSPSNLKETGEDCSSRGTPIPVYALSTIFAIGVTIALVLQIYLGESLVFQHRELFSDHERCTALGHRVLRDGGSSVDAAIASALCLGVVHPHVSGVGGGGIMLVHDIHRNETRVINFLGSAPKAFRMEVLHNVSQAKAGLQVGVPGMLRGLQRAHTLYGGLQWEDVVSRAADVAREGFNVSHSLADAISKVRGVLEAGLLNFYHGNLSQEIVDEVRANGGVLSREDIGNYSVDVELPIEAQYNDKEFIIQVPPPPSAGAVLLSALSLLDGLHISKSNVTETQTRLWIVEALKTALAMACGLGDPNYNSSVTEALSNMLSKSQAEVFGQQLNYSHTSPSEYLSPIHSTQTELVAGQVIVMGQDNLIVSVASSLSRPFGSRLITRSGIVLNSLILDFSWPNTSRGQLQTNQENCVEPGKRPLSLLMPIIVVPASYKCGIHMAVSTSGEQNALSVITQMLVNVLFFHTEKNDSFSPTGLQHQFEPNKLLVRSHFQGDSGQIFHAKAHAVQRVRTEESY
ncbi:glutathione hydrolase 7 isoform X4 [Oreochromis aureus]|uniref:glutathione hydrolase 7 isoform X4 n=1 Tax=Oreochromis aureus TaxID=47969 RepID=UPI0019548CFE|nr:glutathione hydrolase 7 isoform X4 [Oreochromis aureus]